jgi:hypothetical protein
LQIVGASGRWYRVQLEDGVAGYVVARTIGETRRSGDVVAGAAERAAAISTTPTTR